LDRESDSRSSQLQLQHIILNRQADVSVGLCEPANGLRLVNFGFQHYQGYRDAAAGALDGLDGCGPIDSAGADENADAALDERGRQFGE